MEPKDILTLPIAIQVSLGSGYLAYVMAFSGLRQHHTAADAIFGSIAFGLIASAALTWLPLISPWKYAAATGITLAVGLLWRWRIGALLQNTLRKSGISWTDGLPSAWLSVTAMRTDLPLAQIAVDLADGRLLVCDDTRRFKDCPHGPCTLGLDGSVALYVTGEQRPDASWIEVPDVVNIDGARLTYVPADQVRRVELRYWSKSIGSVLKAEAQGSVAEEALEVSSA